MTNMFAAYAETAIPAPVARQQARREAATVKAPSALDLKMAERQRLSKGYRIIQRRERETTLAHEPRLRDFLRYLRTVKPEQSDDLIQAIKESWLPKSVQAVRIFALRLIARHCDRLNRQAGREALDDPIPPETSVYFEAKALLHKGGMA